MGYSHYFHLPPSVATDVDKCKRLTEMTSAIVKESKLPTTLCRLHIRDHGFAVDGCVENLIWPPADVFGGGHGFCKTNHAPYDKVVCALLLAAKNVYGQDLDLSSDGEWDNWSPGRELYKSVFDEEPERPSGVEESWYGER